MKKKFKKDDWLIASDGRICQFISYDDNGWCSIKIQLLSYEIIRQDLVDSLNFWQPKFGDICIFWNTDDEYIIAKFDGIYVSESNTKTLYLSKPIAKSNLINTMFEHCMPFIGVLPSK